MSDPVAKSERSRAKDIRQGVAGQREKMHSSKRKKVDRPWKVMCPPLGGSNTMFFMDREWWCVHKASSKEEAEKWAEKESRSYRGDRTKRFRIDGPDSIVTHDVTRYIGESDGH
jgi:hypothetical protein